MANECERRGAVINEVKSSRHSTAPHVFMKRIAVTTADQTLHSIIPIRLTD